MDLDFNDICNNKFKSLDECLNTSMTSMHTYLKSHPHKRQKIEPVTLLSITLVELNIKRENKSYSSLKTLLDS